MARATTVTHEGREFAGRSMEFAAVSETWNEYRLEDGALVKVRFIPGDIVVTDANIPSGDPLVVIQANVLIQYFKPEPNK